MDHEQQKCSQCGKLVEPPNAVMRMRMPDELGGATVERPFCVNCLENMHAQGEAENEAQKEVRRGERCYLCYDELDPPGGFTLQTPDGPDNSIISLPKIIRVCKHCRDANSTQS